MHSLFNLVIWVILAPFRIIKFIVSDVLIFGIIGGIFSLVKAVVKTVFKIVWNVDGHPWLTEPLALEGSTSNTVSPFVVLE